LSISKIASSFFKTSHKFVPVFASIEDKSRISFSLFEGNSFPSQISSAAQIIPKLSTHLMAVFFIITGSQTQCHKTEAQIFATATACQTSKLLHPQTI